MAIEKFIVFVYIGTLDYRGRLLKTISSFQKRGFKCLLVLGDLQEKALNREACNFEIIEFPVSFKEGRLRFFVNQLKFAWVSGNLIADRGYKILYCFGLESSIAGVIARLFRREVRLVFDSNELHLESFNSRLKRMIWRPLQAMAIRSADAIIHAEPNRMEYFQRVYGGWHCQQGVIENFPYHYVTRPRANRQGRRLRLIYLGALGIDRYTHELIEAARDLADMIELDLVGFASPAFLAELESCYGGRPSENVRLLPPVAYNKIPELLKNYDVGLAFYKHTNLNNYYCAPNKVYDYLMAGMTVIANDFPGLKRVLEDERLGACVGAVDGPSLRNAVMRIIEEDRWANITDEVKRRYSWESQEERLIRMVEVVKL